MLNSNIDWGQDLLYLRRWLDAHPAVRAPGLALSGCVDPKLLGIRSFPAPCRPGAGGDTAQPTEIGTGPPPGWYAVSVNQLRSRSGAYAYFLRCRPVGRAGYSIYLYYLDSEQAGQIRTEFVRDARTTDAACGPTDLETRK
jgi:hypothetical protein